ncbi:MAG: enoyl-CoA hydratase [Hyphomicrobiales bacterium]|nr:enoyl-CoA hydratase [Hyphomicrobiales bacterium]MDE2114041.1 enoyl-CoA hydratase [Hyphomicrobiales bacterium]
MIETQAMNLQTHSSLITSSFAGGVCHLRLTQPSRRNALSLELLEALLDTFSALATDPQVGAIVLSGEGPAFCAGHDLKQLTAARQNADGGEAYFARTFATCSQVMQAITGLPQPVIAAVEGLATAAGCQLVASCDLAVAGAQAGFCTPGVNLGLFCTTPMVAIASNLTQKHALEMLLLGQVHDAGEAYRFGLVNRVVPAGEAEACALVLAQQIADKSRASVRLGKKAFYATRHLSQAAAYDEASAVMTCNMLEADAREGIGALLAKRKPVWSHQDG